MSGDYKISVVVPTYNSEKFVCRAIDSILRQTYSPYEIIVVDDASSDNTVNVVQKRFGDKIRLLKNQTNQGAAATRNVGIKAARGDWIAFLDSDDEWMPNHLECVVEIITKYSLKWCCGQFQRFFKNVVMPRTESWKSLFKHDAIFENFFVAWGASPPIITSGMVINKKMILKAGLFKTSLPVAEDIDMWFEIAHEAPRIGLTSTPTVYHKLRPDSLCSTHVERAELLLGLLKRHLNIAAGNGEENLRLFKPSASKITNWIVHHATLENNAKILREIFRHYSWLLKDNAPFLKIIVTIPGALCFYSWLLKRRLAFREFLFSVRARQCR